MGAKIKGAGTDTIEITGVKKLSDVSYNIMPDRIEAGTFLACGAITGGKIELNNVIPEHIDPLINKLEEANCKIEIGKNNIKLIAPKRLKAVDIKTMPYPGFPTDLQSIYTAMMSTAKGTSIIVENIFESRYKYVQELVRMGARITIEGKTAIVKGTKRIHGTTVKATDLRGGAALIIEALVAKGVTYIDDIQYVLRGYENIEKKLSRLGAKISLEKGE
jgi:UDP-N-acetylglucosamine 1-carboxyvinyltransferase